MKNLFLPRYRIIGPFIFFVIISLAVTVWYQRYESQGENKTNSPIKLYWFIPDGMRADPDTFTVFQWAKEGKLPNIKRMIDSGTYGYSFPNFPSHTPTNFASLLTGAYPSVNGVNDGPMHAIGKPLDSVAIGGFRSVAKKVPPIWKTLEDAGFKVAIVSVPGSTPPEISKGVVLRGRWGGWGADFAAINFETKGNLEQRIKQGRATRLFYFGPQLTEYVDSEKPSGWINSPSSMSDPYEVKLTGWGATVFAYVYDSTDNKTVDYDKVIFAVDKDRPTAPISVGEWSNWESITLQWKVEDKSTPIQTAVKIAVVKLGGADRFFRIRLFYNNLNEQITLPDTAAAVMNKSAGPMVDFVDNYPAQLIYYPEDKKIFLDEAHMSLDWHARAVPAVVNNFHPDVVIHDIYTPNQMLTSRWWMGFVDPNSSQYSSISDEKRTELWDEVKDMYIKLDTIIGEVLKTSDKNTYIVLSSDHGAVPLNRTVNLNNLFAKKGWLKFSINSSTGEPIIDWANTKAIYLKMAHVYINPNGLAGKYNRASGQEYEALRDEVIKELQSLQDEEGQKPLTDIVKWEVAKEYMQLDPDRLGDLVIANAPGFGWNEEMSNDLVIFSTPSVTGYKQAIKAEHVSGMWTPFIIAGPGIKKNNFLGNKPFPLIDQYPTLMNALGVTIPNFVQGKSLPVFNDGR